MYNVFKWRAEACDLFYNLYLGLNAITLIADYKHTKMSGGKKHQDWDRECKVGCYVMFVFIEI